jgi:hypothetical protein
MVKWNAQTFSNCIKPDSDRALPVSWDRAGGVLHFHFGGRFSRDSLRHPLPSQRQRPISLSPHAHPNAPTPHESSLPTAQTPLTRLPAGAFAGLSKRLVHRRSLRFGPVSVQTLRTEERKRADCPLTSCAPHAQALCFCKASALACRDTITQAETIHWWV